MPVIRRDENSLSAALDQASILGTQLRNTNNLLASEQNSGLQVTSNTEEVKQEIIADIAQLSGGFGLGAQLQTRAAEENRESTSGNPSTTVRGELAGEDPVSGDAIAAEPGGRTYQFTQTTRIGSRLPGQPAQVTVPGSQFGATQAYGNLGTFTQPPVSSGDQGVYTDQSSPGDIAFPDPCGGGFGGAGSDLGGGGASINVERTPPDEPGGDPAPPPPEPPDPDEPAPPGPEDPPSPGEPKQPPPDPVTRYTCARSEGQCIPSPGGEFATLEECQNACQQTTWNCVGSVCVEVVGTSGEFALRSECQQSGCNFPCGNYRVEYTFTTPSGSPSSGQFNAQGVNFRVENEPSNDPQLGDLQYIRWDGCEGSSNGEFLVGGNYSNGQSPNTQITDLVCLSGTCAES